MVGNVTRGVKPLGRAPSGWPVGSDDARFHDEDEGRAAEPAQERELG
jgi:hypothetical protein